MGKDYSIYTKADPGPVLVELTAKLIEPLPTIDTVRFVAWHENTDSRTAVFIPEKKEVLIDLGNILNNYDFHRMGMLYIAGVWYTALWTLIHEVIHGRQLENDPDMAKCSDDEVTAFEYAANLATKEAVREWVKENPLPPITEWGWLGKKVIGTVNDLYVKGDIRLADEIDILKAGAIASVDSILAVYEFDSPPKLFSEINDGGLGLKIGDQYYLTAIDFFGLDEPIESVAKSAPTVFMREEPIKVGGKVLCQK